MNKLTPEKKVAVVAALVEGCSVRSTARLTGVAKSTILRLLTEVGTACADFQNVMLRNLPCKRIQVDEIWSFCYAKQKNVTEKIATARVAGDVWTWVAIDADTKEARRPGWSGSVIAGYDPTRSFRPWQTAWRTACNSPATALSCT